jgi:hypothetical protein
VIARALAAATFALGAIACSTDTMQAPAVAGTYTIEFPSTAAAIATESIAVRVFDATDAQELCNTLVVTQKSHGDLPAALAETAPTSPCSLLGGQGGSLAALPFGTYAFLAVAQKSGADFLVGCTTQALASNQTSVPIAVSFASAQTAVPATTCEALSASCAGSCK